MKSLASNKQRATMLTSQPAIMLISGVNKESKWKNIPNAELIVATAMHVYGKDFDFIHIRNNTAKAIMNCKIELYSFMLEAQTRNFVSSCEHEIKDDFEMV